MAQPEPHPPGAKPAKARIAGFALRRHTGRVFRWDLPRPESEGCSFRGRLSATDRRLSRVGTGTFDGPFQAPYGHGIGAMREIRNATVHALLVGAVAPAHRRTLRTWIDAEGQAYLAHRGDQGPLIDSFG